MENGSEDEHRLRGHPTRSGYPPTTQMVLAVWNIVFPVGLLTWAWVGGHSMFLEWQTVGAMGFLVVLGVDTFYQYWLATTWDGVEDGAFDEEEPLTR